MVQDRQFLLDTSVIIAFWRNEQSLQARLASRDRFFVSCISIGELRVGLLRAASAERERVSLERLTEVSVSLPCTESTAVYYAQVKAQLFEVGQPIPDNDVWIAAQAREHDLTLVTRDQHFHRVTGLAVETW